MGISPMRRGDLLPALSLTWTDDTGAVVPLTGVTGCMLNMRDMRTGQQRQGTGQFSIPNPANGVIIYQWASPDTATPGYWRLWVTITWPGGLPQSSDEIDLLIT